MKTRTVDVAVIGAGTAGLRARRAAAARGAEVVLIEAGPYGTTCARVGCMPSKLLIAAADAAWHIRHAPRFGVHAPDGPRVDGVAVMERVRRERDRFVGFVIRDTEALPEAQRLRGRARFVGPNTLEVDDHTRIEAGAVVVASGTRPWLPPVLRDLDPDVLLTNEGIFELADLPESVAVVGAGVIGLELGQALHRLGVRVRIFAHDHRMGPVTDPEVAKAVRAALTAEMSVSLCAPVQTARQTRAGVRLSWTTPDGVEHAETFTRVLAATGRRPALRSLDIEEAGITLDGRGAAKADPYTLQYGDSPIFIAGDANDHRPLLHEASDEGTIAGANAAALALDGPGAVRPHHRRAPLSILFTDPQIALVGQTYAALAGQPFGVGSVDYDDQGRARVIARNQGRVRIYGAPSGRLLGAEMVGPAVEHTAHLLAWAIQAEMTVTDALRMPFYHPVVEEGIRTALRALAVDLGLDHHPEVFAVC